MSFFFGLSLRGPTIGFHFLWHTVELATSIRLCLPLWLIWFLLFRFDALTELGAFMWSDFLCFSVLIVASGPRVKFASCKNAQNQPVFYSTDRSKVVVLVLVLLFFALWFILRGYLFCVLHLCYFVLVFFSPFSVASTSLGEEGANLSVFFFCTFVRFALVWFCLFPLLVSEKGCGL